MKGRIRQWIGYFIMLIGLGFLVFPFFQGAYYDKRQEKRVEYFYEHIASKTEPDKEIIDNPPVDEKNDSENDDDLENDKEESSIDREKNYGEFEKQYMGYSNYRNLLIASHNYNLELDATYQDKMIDKTSVEQFTLNPADYGYDEKTYGVINIPRLGIELGIYLGADYDNMASGVAIFGNTSLPLGLDSENVAIAGHRGWKGTEVFRNIQKMQLDDYIYITTPWKQLVYKVCELRIVTPEDNDWCKIQKGRTLISLMTCHPYHEHYQRYIVFAELVKSDPPKLEETIENVKKDFNESPREVIIINPDGSTEKTLVSPDSIEPDGTEYGSVWSNFYILAEDKMRIVAVVLSGVIMCLGVWLLIVTIKDCKEAKASENEEKIHES